MNVPSFDALFSSRDKLVRTVMDLCEQSNSNEAATETIESAIEVDANKGLYVYGVGGYDGTNAGQSGVKTLQEVLTELAG